MNYHHSIPPREKSAPQPWRKRRMPVKSLASLLVVLVVVVLFFHKPTLSNTNATARATPKATYNPCQNSRATQTVIVSISKQHAWACSESAEVKESPVTTGMTVVRNGVDDNTPTGTYTIQAKYQDLHLRGADANGSWDDPVQYWIPFDDDIGFHDASWQTFPFGSSHYHTDGSHGCVHLPTNFAAWLYNWAPIGTEVVIKT